MTRALIAYVVVLAGCSEPTTGGDDTSDGCPTWPRDAMGTLQVTRATGTLIATAEGGTAPAASAVQIGVQAVVVAPGEELVTVFACTVDFVDEAPWEPWAFAATWRLAGPISTTTMIPAPTLFGTPGMSGGLSERELVCPTPDTCQPEVTDEWLFSRSGAGEIVVTRYALRALATSGWVQTDAPARRVDLDLDITW